MGTVGFAVREPNEIFSRVQKYCEVPIKSDLNPDKNTSNKIVCNALQLLTLVYTYTSEEETTDY